MDGADGGAERIDREGSEGQVVVGSMGVGVRDRLAVAGDDVVEGVGAVQQPLGQLGDGVAVMAHQPVFVSEQVRILGEQSKPCDVHGMGEQVERGELGGGDQIHGRDGRQPDTAPPTSPALHGARHRFLATARLGEGAGAWNTSK